MHTFAFQTLIQNTRPKPRKHFISASEKQRIARELRIEKENEEKIINDFDNFKKIIQKAATDYKNAIQDKWLRKNGRERATKLEKAQSTGEIISAFEKVFTEGNDNEDSLRTYVSKAINEKYNFTIHHSAWINLKYHDLMISKQIEEELREKQQHEVKIATDLLTDLSKIINGYSEKIVLDFDHFKAVLQQAAKDYKNAIKNKWFRNDGRNRATILENAQGTDDISRILGEIFKWEKSNSDSLQTYIRNAISKNYNLKMKNSASLWHHLNSRQLIVNKTSELKESKELSKDLTPKLR